MKESLSPDLQLLRQEAVARPEQKPEQLEDNGTKRWSIYFKSKNLRSCSVKENSTNMVNDQRERRLSDFIGLQNINVSRHRNLAHMNDDRKYFQYIEYI